MMPAITNAESVHQLFDAWHRRYDQVAAQHVPRDGADPQQRSAIAADLADCLGLRRSWVPAIEAHPVAEHAGEGVMIERLAGTSWPGGRIAGLLYRPDTPAPAGRQRPFVLIACGHSRLSKFSPATQRLGRTLARRGAIALCPDNIGQGEREAMGHRNVVTPFAAGLSLQGLIVMETLAWLRWALQRDDVDPDRLAAAGNSGGGTLTLMLIPFEPALAAVASTGYPSSFHFIARKEKKHCHCNILPGIAAALQMHEVYACQAPRPLLLMQGRDDHLFPEDLFCHNARQVRRAYERLDAGDALHTEVVPGLHPWDEQRVDRIADFLAECLGLEQVPPPAGPSILGEAERCIEPWPEDAWDVADIVEHLIGAPVPRGLELWEVFPFAEDSASPLPTVTERGDTRQILAQFRAFLDDRRATGIKPHNREWA